MGHITNVGDYRCLCHLRHRHPPPRRRQYHRRHQRRHPPYRRRRRHRLIHQKLAQELAMVFLPRYAV